MYYGRFHPQKVDHSFLNPVSHIHHTATSGSGARTRRTYGKQSSKFLYIDLMLAWDMMVGLGGLKISHLSTIRLFLEDGAETASEVVGES